jgi:hypothetical protein
MQNANNKDQTQNQNAINDITRRINELDCTRLSLLEQKIRLLEDRIQINSEEDNKLITSLSDRLEHVRGKNEDLRSENYKLERIVNN